MKIFVAALVCLSTSLSLAALPEEHVASVQVGAGGEILADPNANDLSSSDANETDRDVPASTLVADEASRACQDFYQECEYWSHLNECQNNPNFMLIYCRKSCKVCPASAPEYGTMEDTAADLGMPQSIDASRRDIVMTKINDARKYMQETVYLDPEYAQIRSICQNKHENCAFWAALGECENNPGYMQVNCAPVCQSCLLLDINHRCPLDPDAVDALYPGDVNKLFLRVIEDYPQYHPKVMSRPDYAEGDNEENADYQLGPWVITLDEFLSEEEAKRLIDLGGIEGYERSSDVGDMNPDGTFNPYVNEGRTSTNAWCYKECYEDPMAKRIIDRVANLTKIPDENSEYLQMLRYEVGQFYQTHHDLIPHQVARQQGVRILTFYMYLNDVEEGGGTNFPRLGLTVTPKRGRVVLWPSVLDEDPNQRDDRTHHQALPVTKGVKYGANAWIHQRDFKTPNKIGCQ